MDHCVTTRLRHEGRCGACAQQHPTHDTYGTGGPQLPVPPRGDQPQRLGNGLRMCSGCGYIMDNLGVLGETLIGVSSNNRY